MNFSHPFSPLGVPPDIGTITLEHPTGSGVSNRVLNSRRPHKTEISCRSAAVSMTKAIVGIIGGSGIYDLPGLIVDREERSATPWGEPSDALRFGHIGRTETVFLPRHGRGHIFSPSGINYRANIDALKRVGVTDLVSVSACGSFRPELQPGLFVLVDQFVDRTFGRQSSFFGNGCVAHVSMAHPTAPLLRARIAAAAAAENIAIVKGGTYCCMEGPQFSSYAEIANLSGARL